MLAGTSRPLIAGPLCPVPPLQASKTNPGLRVPPQAWPASLQEYLAGGQDLFGLEEHFTNWLHAQVPYDIIFVR